MSQLQKPTLFLLIFTVFMALSMLFFTNDQFSTGFSKLEGNYDAPIFRHVDNTNNNSICALPIYNFRHPTIMKYVSKTPTNPIENCDTSFKPLTSLENGSWSIVSEQIQNCSARCFYEEAYKKIRKGAWLSEGAVDCEFLEAVCWENGTEIYGYIHTQVLHKKSILKSSENGRSQKKNVLVFLIDSLSVGMAKRSLPKTLSYLFTSLNSVEFPFLNKVGENSQPNMFPLWFGKQVEEIRRSNGKSEPVDWKYEDYCERYLDNETHLFKEFKDAGYVTFHAEDWALQVTDSWPFCKGFEKSPVHHSMRPFQLIHEYEGTDKTKRHLHGDLCRTRVETVFEYYQHFLDTYQDEPKFSWMWLNIPAHSDFNGVAWYDEMFSEFFEKNSKVLNDSYVIFMGDHGYRHGNSGLFDTEIGHLEMSNPFLSISLPHDIRDSSEVLKNMRENARKLQTHYDTRATLLDIIKDPDTRERGSSYFQLHGAPRTCSTLPIPHQYCICQVKKVEVEDPSILFQFGAALINHVNHKLSDLTDICETYELLKVTSLLHYGDFELVLAEHTYKIAVLSEPHAHFETTVVVDQNENFHFGKITRLDTYGDTVECTKLRRFDKLCHCKEFDLSSTTTVGNL